MLTGEGESLSQGERQLLNIARAACANPPVLILDEATSSLDVLTEKKIVNNLMAMTNKTIVFVAHRLSIAQRTDRIIVMDQGKIVEEGSHKELLAHKGFYYKLFN